MIRHHRLYPADGSLSGSGLRLDFQVKEGPYRVDFLANQWLVIEIDGAAYHSTPEAKKRDKRRDQYFEGLGYTVLRIPAKVVFDTPDDAILRVRTALQIGKRPAIVRVRKSGWQRLSETVASINQGLSEINASIDKSLAVDSALKEARDAFGNEKAMIQIAFFSAQTDLKTADCLKGKDPRARAIYEHHYSRLMEILSKSNVGVYPLAIRNQRCYIMADDNEAPHNRRFLPALSG
jgi:very-short-patch-repair endonuclease